MNPRRDLGGPADTWRLMLFGEIVRLLDTDVRVRPDVVQRLPGSGRWESGLARVRPAMDDVLGATAFSVAWRWGCASLDRPAWAGFLLTAERATDRKVSPDASVAGLAQAGEFSLFSEPADRSWVLDGVAVLGVSGPVARVDWTEVDRVADITSAWLDVPWRLA